MDRFEITLPAGSGAPYALASGGDGTLWVTLLNPGGLGRVDVAGGLEPFPLDALPMQLAVDADGTVWYTRSDDRIGRRDLSGTETLFDLPAGSAPYGISRAPDGVWFTAGGSHRVGRLTADGALHWTDLPVPESRPAMLAVTADGAVWVALNAAGALARLHDGEVDLIRLPSPASAPVGVAAAGDAVWYADIGAGQVGLVDATGVRKHIDLPDPQCRPHAVAADPDGGCWVTEWAATRLARVTDGGDVTEYDLPGAEPHGLLVTKERVWVAMESGSLAAVGRAHAG